MTFFTFAFKINVKWFWDNLIFPIYSLNGVLNSWAIKSRVDKIGYLRKNGVAPWWFKWVGIEWIGWIG